MVVWQLLAIAALIGANGFFVAAEFSLVRVRASQIVVLVSQNDRRAKIVQYLISHLESCLSATQLGVTLCTLGLGWLGEPWVGSWLEAGLGLLGRRRIALPRGIIASAALVLISSFHIILGEQSAKFLGISRPRRTALWVAVPLRGFLTACYPFIWFLKISSSLVLRFLGVKALTASERTHTEEEFRHIVAESTAGGHLKRHERLLIENVLDLEEKTARRIMVPRTDMVVLRAELSLAENLRIVAESGHTRFPLCGQTIDDVQGVIHVKDLYRARLRSDGPVDLKAASRAAWFVPETILLHHLLVEFQRQGQHLALLVDEFGGVSGMVTLENVLEELVGPIQDEFDRESPLIVAAGAGRWELDAGCPVDDMAETCGIPQPETEADTVGGLVLERLGRVGKAGDQVELGAYRLVVLRAEPRRVRRVRLEKPAEMPAASEPPPGVPASGPNSPLSP